MKESTPSPTAEREPARRRAAAFDLVQAHFLARASEAAYGRVESLEAQRTHVFASGAASGYVARKGDQVILALRGTSSVNEEWNHALVQWLVNLNYKQADALGGRVHQGFVDALNPVLESVHREVRSALPEGQSLWVTGHSLGGALAILAGARLAAEGIPVAAVYTFGAPRVGDAAFSASYPVPVHQVENANDIVCHLPPPAEVMMVVKPLVERTLAQRVTWTIPTDVSYADTGKITFIDWDGVVWPEVTDVDRSALASKRFLRFATMVFSAQQRESLIADHRISGYRECLAAAQERSTREPIS